MDCALCWFLGHCISTLLNDITVKEKLIFFLYIKGKKILFIQKLLLETLALWSIAN